MTKRKILVTSALPYANGPIHLGHLIEYIQADIWCRYHKLFGHNCFYICADDAHGTPIMINAQKKNMTPEKLIAETHTAHQADLRSFHIQFDHYSSTHTANNQEQVNAIYQSLRDQDLIDKRVIEQFYDEEKQMFLPDRFIKGTCPACKEHDQYSDGCEKCGATYSPTEVIDPYSVISQTTPSIRSSEHYFFRLSDPRCLNFLRAWTKKALSPEVYNKIKEWLGESVGEEKISDWDISRDAPYFGFPIPGAPGKFFYVWLDAPIAYISTCAELCALKELSLNDFWGPEASSEIYHFIGKDIIYFHALFWPALLEFSGKKTPTQIFVHGFLTINKEKMSKSRGNFLEARHYLDRDMNPEWMRYYIAAHTGKTIKDIDLNWLEFSHIINSHLIGKYINIASRTVGFVNKKNLILHSHQELPPQERDLEKRVVDHLVAHIPSCYEDRDLARVIREIMKIADIINQYIDDQKPWLLARDESTMSQAALVSCVSVSLRCFFHMSVCLQPILPETFQKIEKLFGLEKTSISMLFDFEDCIFQIAQPYEPLLTRVSADHETFFLAQPTIQQ